MVYKAIAAMPTAAMRPAAKVCLAPPATEVEVLVAPPAAPVAELARLLRDEANEDTAPVAEETREEALEARLEAPETALETAPVAEETAPLTPDDAPLATDEAPPTTPPRPKRVVDPMVEVRTELPEVIKVTTAEVVTAEEDPPEPADPPAAP
jgi:hypothetical protein